VSATRCSSCQGRARRMTQAPSDDEYKFSGNKNGIAWTAQLPEFIQRTRQRRKGNVTLDPFRKG
jgi:hypothetical protein